MELPIQVKNNLLPTVSVRFSYRLMLSVWYSRWTRLFLQSLVVFGATVNGNTNASFKINMKDIVTRQRIARQRLDKH
jgi:hypothetical protein